MSILYSIGIHLFYFLMLIVSPFNKKASLWIRGRLGWRKKVSLLTHREGPVFWFHAASLGEFEQGMPVIEALKKEYPSGKILVTFYSPSGYEIRKNYALADCVCYLPLDTWYNAREFLKKVNPSAVFFIKYEFWYFYLKELNKSHIPVYLISAIFRKQQVFFKWYGTWYQKQLFLFRSLFVQDYESVALLQSSGIQQAMLSGDTRFDRVAAIARTVRHIDAVENFIHYATFTIIAGSTWLEDENLLATYINHAGPDIKFIIAPHEIQKEHIDRLSSLVKKDYMLFSETAKEDPAFKQVLIIDNIGMLSSLYAYGQIAYIGGGFGKGIHNILEAAVHGIPVIFGPRYGKFKEAVDMIDAGCAFTIKSDTELSSLINTLIANPVKYASAGQVAKQYVHSHTGATKCICDRVISDLTNNG